FSALVSGASKLSSTSTNAGSADPTATAPTAGVVALTTISGYLDTETWNSGNLVNGTGSAQSSSMQNSPTPNVGTTSSWNFQGKKWTIATEGNVVAFVPANFRHPTNKNIDIKELLQAAAAHGLISGNDGVALGK